MVDEYYGYGPDDIDKNFRGENKGILSEKRGNGYWLWKPYFLLKALKEKLNYGDYLIYTDACILYTNKTKILINFLINKNAEMWLYKLPYIEREWTKRDIFIFLKADISQFANTRQYNAAIQIYKKSNFTQKFLEELLFYSKYKRIITDDDNIQPLPNLKGFIENRHDQSILSILNKKYNQSNFFSINNDLDSEMPYIFCHYRRINFENYEDLKKKCIIMNKNL